MSKSLEPVLHLDIIENIVDILFKDDDAQGLQHMKTFSLTCQSFLPLCRKYIFASIEIVVGKRRSSKHIHVLETPTIAKYVRHLTIRIIKLKFDSHYFDQVGQHLTRLQYLTVSFGHSTLNHWDWHSLPSSMQCSLTNLMHLPTLRRLCLESIRDFIISDLLTCANLKYLSVNNIHITTEHDSVALQDPTGEIFGKAQQLGDITLDGKEILNLRYPPRFIVNDAACPAMELAKMVTPSLETSRRVGLIDDENPLEVFFAQELGDTTLDGKEIFYWLSTHHDVIVSDAACPDMELAEVVTPSLPTLRRVGFNVDFDGKDPLDVLCYELQRISGKNRLESIEMRIAVCQTGPKWDRLEEVLLFRSGWPMLKHISLIVDIHSHHDVPRIDAPFGIALKSLPQTQFTGLMSSKNFDFQFSVQEIFPNPYPFDL